MAKAVIIHNFTLGEGLTFIIHHRVLPPMCTLKLLFYSQKVDLCKFLHCSGDGIFDENGIGCAFAKRIYNVVDYGIIFRRMGAIV